MKKQIENTNIEAGDNKVTKDIDKGYLVTSQLREKFSESNGEKWDDEELKHYQELHEALKKHFAHVQPFYMESEKPTLKEAVELLKKVYLTYYSVERKYTSEKDSVNDWNDLEDAKGNDWSILEDEDILGILNLNGGELDPWYKYPTHLFLGEWALKMEEDFLKIKREITNNPDAELTDYYQVSGDSDEFDWRDVIS